ncbi:uncharacterized protein MONBRDRAFT_8547 [Monosiga brevicollis MX1]|uniref:DJ-1/PfpI domain-containing protein n=1 Tax=Monosiga brevicollis TaxID=81824 RepID=A9V0C7_MONBE|nr:uncharacterized protein MONBRDRAFT_8547 [Monosiga brevicollis MX1]EDQ89134.1 predicted protein [Monosiga brevicollis MX1]|eukprot:XP_001746239.1 hypothetical protein [Monosiga brevicollis MX1]
MAEEASKRALVLLAPGAEEMETVITVDVLRRAKLEVVLAGLESADPITCSRNVVLVPDMALAAAQASGPFDVLVLPGGAGGAAALRDSATLTAALTCLSLSLLAAATTVLAKHNIGAGKRATSHPGVADDVRSHFQYSEDRVVVDGNLITSRGPGTTMEFALAIVRHLLGEAAVQTVAPPMIMYPGQA